MNALFRFIILFSVIALCSLRRLCYVSVHCSLLACIVVLCVRVCHECVVCVIAAGVCYCYCYSYCCLCLLCVCNSVFLYMFTGNGVVDCLCVLLLSIVFLC